MLPTSPPGPDRERWRRLETICDAALRLDGAERADYLESACEGDASLRRDVEDLLAHERGAARFLEAAPGAVAASLLSADASLAGTRLGDYEIEQRLGKGGMGVVYRARDTRLDRDVALKLVADRHVAADGGGRRLRQEARAAARLNHPNICTVYEVTSVDGATCIAMELIEGTSLRQALAPGPLAPDRACRIGHQLADALDHAHQQGVTHRDLKSSNVMIRPDGRVKVIDFGIADCTVRPGDQTETPRTRATRPGVVGTLAYIAPEVLQGSYPDARSDIWSLGVVLYEMAAGQLPFDGRTESDLAAAILRDPLRPLPAATPPSLARTIERCLARMPNDRPARAGEVALALGVAISAVPDRRHMTRRPLGIIAVAAAAAAAIALPAIYLRNDERPSLDGPVRFENPIQVTNAVGVEESPAWSPDGRMLAFSASATGGLNEDWDIWVVQLGGEPLNRTAGFTGRNLYPAWSPDGSSIAFWSSREGGGCYVTSALGGAPRLIMSGTATHPGPPQWSSDGSSVSCVVGPADRALLQTVSITTGEVVDSFELPGFGVRLFVSRSPSGKHLAMVSADGGLFADVSELSVIARDSRSPVLVTDGRKKTWSPRWSADGRTLYYLAHAGSAMTVWAQRLTAERAPDGEPRSLTAGIDIRDFAWSADGRRLGYSQGRRVANVYRVPFTLSRVSTWADVQQLTFDQADNQCVEVDRFGTRLVVTSDRSGSFDLWTMPAAGGAMAQLTSDPSAEWCADWSPDGSTLAFFAARSGNRDVWTMPAAGGPWRPITSNPTTDLHPRWSYDGKEIFFTSRREGVLGVWSAPGEGGTNRVVSRSQILEPSPIDARMLTISGNEIFLEHPGRPGRSVRLGRSSGGPRWTPDGRYALLRAAGDLIHIVAVDGRSPERLLVDLRGRRGSVGVYGTPTDGKYVYFVWTEDTGDIWVMDVAR
jgi:serine/threonine protein kinase/Tol biopolymer transport system component